VCCKNALTSELKVGAATKLNPNPRGPLSSLMVNRSPYTKNEKQTDKRLDSGLKIEIKI